MHSITVLYTLAIYRQKDYLRGIENTNRLRQLLEIKKGGHRKSLPGLIQFWVRSNRR
jgi:hypothetical protein